MYVHCDNVNYQSFGFLSQRASVGGWMCLLNKWRSCCSYFCCFSLQSHLERIHAHPRSQISLNPPAFVALCGCVCGSWLRCSFSGDFFQCNLFLSLIPAFLLNLTFQFWMVQSTFGHFGTKHALWTRTVDDSMKVAVCVPRAVFRPFQITRSFPMVWLVVVVIVVVVVVLKADPSTQSARAMRRRSKLEVWSPTPLSHKVAASDATNRTQRTENTMRSWSAHDFRAVGGESLLWRCFPH